MTHLFRQMLFVSSKRIYGTVRGHTREISWWHYFSWCRRPSLVGLLGFLEAWLGTKVNRKGIYYSMNTRRLSQKINNPIRGQATIHTFKLLYGGVHMCVKAFLPVELSYLLLSSYCTKYSIHGVSICRYYQGAPQGCVLGPWICVLYTTQWKFFQVFISSRNFQSNAFNPTLSNKRFQSKAFNQRLSNWTLSIKGFQIQHFQYNAFNRTLPIERF